MSNTEQSEERAGTDGRIRRSERSRQLIVQAMLSLVEEGNLVPTAQQVSKRAAVGIRTVFRHFSDMDSLFAATDERMRDVYEGLFLGGDRNGSLAERILHAAQRHDQAFEQVQPFMLSTQAQLWKSETLRRKYARNMKGLRRDLEEWLPELKHLPPERQAAAEAAMSFENWHQLHGIQGLDNKATVAAIAEVLYLLFGLAASRPTGTKSGPPPD